MIKYLLFLISTSSIMLLNVLVFEEVDIEHDIPDYLVAGDNYVVNVTINKGAIAGFAKFQMEIPDGINVKSIEAASSSFTFNEQVVKNIWMSVPEDESISLSYTLEIGSNYQGSGDISAQFVYIKDNERYSVGMQDHPVNIGEAGAVAQGPGEDEAGFVPEMIQSKRDVRSLGNKEFEVKISVEKDGLEGFAKIQDELPEGYEASLLVGGESHFTVADGKVKFIWFNVPVENEIEVSYLLKGGAEAVDASELTGTFNFIYKDDARFIDLPSKTLLFDPSETEEELLAAEEAATEIEPEVAPVEEVTPAIGAAIIVDDEPKEEPIIVEETPEPEPEPVVSIEAPQTDVFYRVQLAAGRNNVKVTYFKNKYQFRSEIFLENHEGWFKYTTGNYDQYRQARDRREEIKTAYNFRGPFVTAYNSGERITVQEALLITKQKWVK